MTGWQPIETAPKDGTHIIIATDVTRSGVEIVSWEANRFEDADGYGYSLASHWMPLPKPPTEASK